MKRISILLLLAALYGTDLISQKASPIETLNEGFVAVAQATVPKVVSVSAVKKNSQTELFRYGTPFGTPQPKGNEPTALGSGVIIDARGYIVTNNHVIEDATSVSITLSDRRKFKCKIIGADPGTDIAVMKIEGDVPKDLPVIEMADSSKLRTGQIVVAVGNAFGFSNTVTTGIISAVKREGLGLADYEDLIQTDAAINPGNSGGALVDIKGKLIGINTAIFTRSGGSMGLGFAIPSNSVKVISDELIKTGKIVRGWVGVRVQELTDEMADKFGIADAKGVIVAEVLKNSPAAKGGIVNGDIILAVDGRPTKNVYELKRYIALIKPGKKAEILILRKNEKLKLTITVETTPDADTKVLAGGDSGLGITVTDLDEEIMYKYNIRDKAGVLITNVAPASPAEKAGLAPGDLVIEVEKTPVKNTLDYNKALKELEKNRTILFLIKRGGAQQYVIIKVKE
jgi:serine protease Do